MNTDNAAQYAAKIKKALDALEESIKNLPASPETRRVRRLTKVLHNRLDAAAHAAAEHFDTDVTVMSGGGDKTP